MWSAGLICYEIACGDGTLAYFRRGERRRPVGDWLPRVRAGGSPEAVTPLPATAHPAVVAAMRACLVLDPAARPTAAAVFASLHAALPPGVARDRYVSAAAAEASDAAAAAEAHAAAAVAAERAAAETRAAAAVAAERAAADALRARIAELEVRWTMGGEG